MQVLSRPTNAPQHSKIKTLVAVFKKGIKIYIQNMLHILYNWMSI